MNFLLDQNFDANDFYIMVFERCVLFSPRLLGGANTRSIQSFQFLKCMNETMFIFTTLSFEVRMQLSSVTTNEGFDPVH